MGKLGKDAKDLLIGNDGPEAPKDFKSELQNAIKDGIIKKSEGSILLEAKVNGDKRGETIIKKQEDYVKRIKDNEVYDSSEQEEEARKKKEEKEKEKERKRKEREAFLAIQMKEKNNSRDVKSVNDKPKDLSEKE